MLPKLTACAAVFGVACGLGYSYLPRSDGAWETLYDQVQEQLPAPDPSPAGSLSQKVLHNLHDGYIGSDDLVLDKKQREDVNRQIKSQVIILLQNLAECRLQAQNTTKTVGQCMIENHGFHTVIKESSIGPFAGDGVFARLSLDKEFTGDIDAYQVVGIYEGDLISPYKQWVAAIMGGKHPDNEWLLSRAVDGYIIDGKPYGSESKNYIELKPKLNNSVHVGQLVNHPPKGKQPNIAYYHITIKKDDISHDSIGLGLGESYPSSSSKSYAVQKEFRVSVMVSLVPIAQGEELFADYGYCAIYHWPASDFAQPTLMLPPWYHPVDGTK